MAKEKGKSKISSSEKQCLYRERRDADPVRRPAYLAKEKEGWTKKKEAGKWTPAADLSDRAKRKRQKYNREAQAKHRNSRSDNAVPSTPLQTSDFSTSTPSSSR